MPSNLDRQQPTRWKNSFFWRHRQTRAASCRIVSGDYGGFGKVHPDNFNILTAYMGAQRFRTPKGLDYLKQETKSTDNNFVLKTLGRFFQVYTTM